MKIAIIGGGVGGLMSALYLTKQGHEIVLYEKEHKVGGRLTFVEYGEYRIDEGPTIVLLPRMFQNLLSQAGISPDRYELLLCDPLYTIRYPDGTVYTKYPDAARQADEVERVFPGEREGFLKFMEEGKSRFAIGKSAFLENAFVRKADFWTFQNIRNLLELKPQWTVKKLMAQYFRDERLRLAYTLQALYIGGDPFNAPAMYSLVPFSEHEHGVHYLRGGYGSLIPLLAEELQARPGTEIRLNTPVEQLVIEEGRATGVKTAAGTESFDAVLYNGEFPSIGSILPSRKIKDFEASSGCVLVYLGLDRIYHDVNVHQFFIGSDYEKHMKQVFQTKEKPDDPAFYTFHPSIIDDSLAPPGKGVLYMLIPVPSGSDVKWGDEREWLDAILERAEALSFPGLKEATEWMEVRTPTEAEAFGLFKGGSFGIGPTLFQSGVFRPQVKPFPIDGLYAAGASIHPGGGIPIVMQGAKLAAEQMAKDFKKEGSNRYERQASI